MKGVDPSDPLSPDRRSEISVFVPAAQAAICADCGGVFLLTARHCPGCGSKHWTLLNCATPVARIEGEETK